MQICSYFVCLFVCDNSSVRRSFGGKPEGNTQLRNMAVMEG